MKLETQWIVGFVDGEGCFHIEINSQPTMTLKYQVLCNFVVTQHVRDIQVLHALKHYFQCGVVRYEKPTICCYRVRKLQDLSNKILPFFEQHSLKTKKNIEFRKFRQVVLMMKQNLHLTQKGLDEIRDIVSSFRHMKQDMDSGELR